MWVPVVVLALLFVLATSLSLGRSERCYPPLCRPISPTANAAPSEVAAVPHADAAELQLPISGRPAPFVLGGLFMVSLSFGLIILDRRSAIARSRSQENLNHREIASGASATPVAQLSEVH